MEVYKGLIYQGKDYSNRLEVSNLGNLRNIKTGHMYKLHINKNGYFQCCISLGSRDSKMIFKVHKAVAETFVPNLNNKPYVNHIDGNKLNNKYDNLEWVTPRENMVHAHKNRLITVYKGCDSPCSKLTQDEISFIKSNYICNDRAFGTRSLAKKFGVSHSTISEIIHNIRYVNN